MAHESATCEDRDHADLAGRIADLIVYVDIELNGRWTFRLALCLGILLGRLLASFRRIGTKLGRAGKTTSSRRALDPDT